MAPQSVLHQVLKTSPDGASGPTALLNELSDGSWPLNSKRKAYGLQPPLFHESFIFFSDESNKFNWLKIIFKNNK